MVRRSGRAAVTAVAVAAGIVRRTRLGVAGSVNDARRIDHRGGSLVAWCADVARNGRPVLDLDPRTSIAGDVAGDRAVVDGDGAAVAGDVAGDVRAVVDADPAAAVGDDIAGHRATVDDDGTAAAAVYRTAADAVADVGVVGRDHAAAGMDRSRDVAAGQGQRAVGRSDVAGEHHAAGGRQVAAGRNVAHHRAAAGKRNPAVGGSHAAAEHRPIGRGDAVVRRHVAGDLSAGCVERAAGRYGSIHACTGEGNGAGTRVQVAVDRAGASDRQAAVGSRQIDWS